jgi:PAT family beta-lactamase induction signal transducer AmpG
MNSIVQVFANRRMALVLFLGFCSGLPLSLTGSTLQAWMTEAQVDLATIGRFALVGLPYTMKFLWSPFLDSVAPPFWGRRRGWAILTQLGLVISIALLGSLDPQTEIGALSILAIAIAFFSASQDIVLDAFRTEVLKSEELGAGAGVYVMGYRLAMLVSGALALILADHLEWKQVYWLMAGVMALGSLVVLFAPEPEMEAQKRVARLPWRDRVFQPFLDFFKRNGAVEILLFVMVYKLSTMMATALTTTFLISLGFTKTEIGAVTKVFGLIATIVGTLTGGALMVRWGTKRSLWIFGFLQSIAGLTFLILSYTGKNTAAMTAVITVENFMIGLGVAALSGFMMSVCNRQFTATQFALLSSLTAVSRVVLVSQAGVLAEKLGWHGYFVFSVLLAIPGLLLLTRYDRWQSMELGRIGTREITQGLIFLAGLIAIASEPIWNWLGQRETAPVVAQTGAALVGIAVIIGLLPHKKPVNGAIQA